jgi:hypothetical protein
MLRCSRDRRSADLISHISPDCPKMSEVFVRA